MAANVVALRTAMTATASAAVAETAQPTNNAIIAEEDLPESKTTTTTATTTTTTKHGISIMIEQDEMKQHQQQLSREYKQSNLVSAADKYQIHVKDVNASNAESAVVILVVNGQLEKSESDTFVGKDQKNYHHINNNNNDSNYNKNKNNWNNSQMLLMHANAAAAVDVQHNNVVANDDDRNDREKSVYAIGDKSDIETSYAHAQLTEQHSTKQTVNNGVEECEADKEVLLETTMVKSDCKQMLKAKDGDEDASAATTVKNQLLNVSELLLSSSNGVNLEVGQSNRFENNVEETGIHTRIGQQQAVVSRIIKYNDEAVNGTNDSQHNDHDDDDDDDDVEKAVAIVVDGASIGDYKNGPSELCSLVRHRQIQSQPLRDSAAAKHFASPATKADANEHASALTETVSGYASKETHHVVTIQINSGGNNNNSNNNNKNNNNCNIVSEGKNLENNFGPSNNAKPKTTCKGNQVTVVNLNVAKNNHSDNDNKLIEQLNSSNKITSRNCGTETECAKLRLNTVHVQSEKMVVQKSTAACSPVTSNAITTPATGGSGGNGGGSGGTGSASSITELNVSNSSYLYYMVSSGQFSPCETLDSGTCSDLDSGAIGKSASVTGETIIRGNDGAIVVGVGNSDVPKLEMHLKTTKIRINNASPSSSSSSSSSVNASNTNLHHGEHERAYSLTDSEESESSSLSCDSLHSSEYCGRQMSLSPTGKLHTHRSHNDKTRATERSVLATFLPDSLLRDIRDRKFVTNDFITKYGNDNDNDHANDNDNGNVNNNDNNDNDHNQTTSASGIGNADGIPSTAHNQSYIELQQAIEDANNAATVVTTQETRAKRIGKLSDIGSGGISRNFVDPQLSNRPCKYEADKYYTFHVKEHENCRSFGNVINDVGVRDSSAINMCEGETRGLHEDAFAGYKDIRCGSASSTIRSSKGTVRGVKNRVRNGIATFLQLQQPSVKNFKEKDLGKVVLYTTSMGIIRDTYAKCTNVKKILRTLLIKFEERDVFMSVEYQQEIRERMHSQLISVPQLFVEGQHIGDAETVERLNESGELRQLLKPYKSIATTFTCQTCGGYRLLPCPSCKGSKKSVHRNHFTAEFVALKCMNCDEVGLVKCHNC